MRKNLLVLLFIGLYMLGHAQRSFNIEINSTQPSILIASAGEEPTLSGSDLLLGGTPAVLGGTEPYTYQWLPSNNLDNPNIANPVFSGSSSSEYTLLITDSRGCLAADTIQIIITRISDATEPEVLKAFPNPRSGKIRILAPKSLNLRETSFQVIDAAGRIVYSTIWTETKAEFLLDVSQLSSGQYTISLNDRITKVSNKIIIQ